jgi:hypothetical protein
MNRLNPAPESHPPWAADRIIQALMNLLYLIKITPRESHEIDLYLELAQRELEWLTTMFPQQFKEVARLKTPG